MLFCILDINILLATIILLSIWFFYLIWFDLIRFYSIFYLFNSIDWMDWLKLQTGSRWSCDSHCSCRFDTLPFNLCSKRRCEKRYLS
jgi:hypothetical protein